MYTSYSTLQRKQLTKQVYTDTQSTYLLVYAPGRHQALEHALENQLHRKFRLVTELAPALTDSVEGVLLVSEDLECTSTALTYFAGALRTGADLVVCDAAFGFDGSTALYLSTQHIPCSRCAMVSRKLLDRIRAAARGRDSVTELLRLATAMAENCHRIPQSLLHFRREYPQFFRSWSERNQRTQGSARRAALCRGQIPRQRRPTARFHPPAAGADTG